MREGIYFSLPRLLIYFPFIYHPHFLSSLLLFLLSLRQAIPAYLRCRLHSSSPVFSALAKLPCPRTTSGISITVERKQEKCSRDKVQVLSMAWLLPRRNISTIRLVVCSVFSPLNIRLLLITGVAFAVDGKAIPNIPFDARELYSGLLPTSDTANETKKLFFWFYPS